MKMFIISNVRHMTQASLIYFIQREDTVLRKKLFKVLDNGGPRWPLGGIWQSLYTVVPQWWSADVQWKYSLTGILVTHCTAPIRVSSLQLSLRNKIIFKWYNLTFIKLIRLVFFHCLFPLTVASSSTHFSEIAYHLYLTNQTLQMSH